MKEDLSTIITFKVKDANFAFDALKVRHILELVKITRLPNAPSFISGVLNLHGIIVPIADLRMMLGIEKCENTHDTSIIIISPNGMTDSYIGLIVDLVKEVVPISFNLIKPTLIEGALGLVDSFIGTVQLDGDFVNIIDLDELIIKIEQAKQ
jgi:purine-binding chemotaxis protein CheW